MIAKKIIVTGAAGFIGSHTVDQLLAAGHRVWGIDNFRSGRRKNLTEALQHRGFALHDLDVTDGKPFIDCVGEIRPDVIIHLAALVSVPESVANPALNDRLNLHATRIVAEAAIIHHVSRIVFASSAAVYGDPVVCPIPEDALTMPLSPYGSAKLASEALLLDCAAKHDLTAYCLRYFNVYGPRQDPRSSYSGVISIFVDRLKQHTPPVIYGDGGQTRDFISVHDVARANVIAATKEHLESGVANICTSRATSISELWSLLSRHQPKACRPSYAPMRPSDIRYSCGLSTAARRDLDFTAQIDMETGLTELL